ncbi:MAG: hypothetical protein ACM3VT_16395 [Solirubrobacterales bacterium]
MDVARYVVVGRLSEIETPGADRGDGVRYGRAKVDAMETWTGAFVRSIEFRTISFVPAKWGGEAPLWVHKVGECGIWILCEGDGVLSDRRFLPEGRREEIRGMLEMLATRKWSAAVNGLEAWAGVVHWGDKKDQAIIFAVRNATNRDSFVPVADQKGFVAATVACSDGGTTRCLLGAAKGASDAVSCRRLAAGQTIYLEPGWPCVDLTRRQSLPPGGTPSWSGAGTPETARSAIDGFRRQRG